MSTAATAGRSDDWLERMAQRRRAPSWLLSLGLHCGTFLVAALLIRDVPRGAAVEPGRQVGIALVQASGSQQAYFSGDDAHSPAAGLTAANATAAAAVPALPTAAPELTGPQLPSRSEAASGLSGLPGAAELPGGGELGQPGPPRPSAGSRVGNDIETGVFGVRGVGSRFVYVFDRSASMAGFQGRPLAAAKRELLASLQSLRKVHQFQVVFYNQRPLVMNPHREAQPGMFFADDPHQRLAEDFVRSVVADGGTLHMDALKLALRMQPDVLFFLTDGDEPTLSAGELAEIRRLNRSTSISTVEFGAGPKPPRTSFLQTLADQNEGQYVYVDVTRLP